MIIMQNMLWGAAGADAVTEAPPVPNTPVIALRVGVGYQAVTTYMTAEQAAVLITRLQQAAGKLKRMQNGSYKPFEGIPQEQLVPIHPMPARRRGRK